MVEVIDGLEVLNSFQKSLNPAELGNIDDTKRTERRCHLSAG
jgi:hypothetical protein